MIIGLTGSNCAGKDTVADYLVNVKGFKHYSLSDVIRDELKRRGLETSRENLINTGKSLRGKLGNSVLAKKILKKCIKGSNYILTSIRHPAEVRALKRRKGFMLVNVDAPRAVRFKRMQMRKRPGDPLTLAQFKEFENREMQVKGPGQQMGKTMALADITFNNSGESLAGLHKRIDKLLIERGYD